MAGIFAVLMVYLGFQLEGNAMYLLLIPALFGVFLLGVALIATDEGLQKVVNVLMAFNV